MATSAEIAQLIAEQGRLAAEGKRRVGQIYGNLFSNIGTTIGNIPAQLQEQKILQANAAIRNQQMQIGQFQLDSAKRAQMGQQVLAKAIQQFGDDHQAVAKAVSQAGFPDQGEAYLSTATKNATALDTLRKIDEDREDKVRAAVGEVANNANSLEEFTAGIALLNRKNALPKELQQQIQQTSDPSQWEQLRATMRQFSPSYQKQQEELNKPVIIPAGGVQSAGGKIIARGEPRQPTGSATEKDDERYRGIQAALAQKQPVPVADLAWAQGYEKQKTLGVDTSASAAAQRQANAIAAQTAQQARAQGFTESQVGRKELTDKVEQPYLDAREKAETLRSVIEAAKNGNMTAASVQSLLGTLGLVTTEGVKRINTVELENVSGAGSLLERIKGAAGKVVSGQPLSSKLQNDLADLSKVLEQSARSKYERGFKAVTGRYGLKDEKALDNPAGGAAVAAAPKVLTIDQIKQITAKTGQTYAEAKADAEKRGYIVR